MKTTQSRSLAVAAVVCSLFAAPALHADETSRDADHAALRQLRQNVVSAINNLDSQALVSCFAREFVFTAVNQATVTNQAQVQDFLDRMFRAKDSLVTSLKTEPIADILTRFIDSNTGICYGSTRDTYTLRSGGTVIMTNRWTATVIKEDGQWKVAAAHVGTDFMNNPAVDRAVAAMAKKLIILVAVSGLLLLAALVYSRIRRGSAAPPA